MADRSAGGCVRRAATSAASTRPAASVSGASARGSGSTPSSTRASASATDNNDAMLLLGLMILGPIVAGLAALLLQQPDARDGHAFLDRLDHVVDGQAGDRHRGERLHLHPGLADDLDGRLHHEAGQAVIRL